MLYIIVYSVGKKTHLQLRILASLFQELPY